MQQEEQSPLKLGIIAGEGSLPSEVAKLHYDIGGEVVIAALKGEADLTLIANYPHEEFSIGSAGKLLEYFRDNKVEEVIIIGGVKRPNLKSIKVDMVGSILLTKILKEKFLGDNCLLKIISDFIESKGFKVISPKKLLELTDYNKLKNKVISKITKQDQIDIKLGVKVLSALGGLDIGQSIIVSNSYVLGIEAAEGTDNLIERCRSLRKTNNGGILIKGAKSFQDLRLDLPTIGPNTILKLAEGGYDGLAVEKSTVIITKPEKTIQLINKNNLFISYFNAHDT